ncbi:hypothetical protein [Bordetella bronchialis]|uniref:PD-(D/E)XK nuclease superfamily protein n=1 Tax=Bordetella bronchialis TaxID=463025 RepID=A0ABM6CNT0_9BORD|nr:hypothetical protein [Bordetella bronchialis]ANN65611.1 hypothetical protein BAU06_04240 [Bordetella bronchialis]
MTSFFSAIQNWFHADLYGRHLGLILQEVGNRRPHVLASFLAKVFNIPLRTLGTVRFEAEYVFKGRLGRRRADLAVFCGDAKEPTALIEIKYHDKPLPETELKPAQLADYKAWRDERRDERYVLLLTRELYRADGIEVRRWDALTRHLRTYAGESDLIEMLVKYLEEEGNAMQDINGSSLIRYLKRLVCNNEFGANNLDGPAQFSNLLKNMQLTSGYFHGHFKTAWREAGIKTLGEDYGRRSKSASIDFAVRNRVREQKSGRSPIAGGYLENRLKYGGDVYVFARHSLGHGTDWIRVAYGVRFDIAPGDGAERTPATYLWARIVGAKLKRSEVDLERDRKINFKWVTENAELAAEKVEAWLNKLLIDVIDCALRSKADLLAQQKKALKLLQKSLVGGRQPLLNGGN